MPVGNVYVLHGVRFPGAQFLDQLQDLDDEINPDELTGYASGYPDPLFIGDNMQKPAHMFGTTQLKTMLDLCGATFIADLSAGNTDLYYKMATDLGVRQSNAATVHQRVRMTNGCAYWDQITAQQGQTAAMRGRIIAQWDGTNPPFQGAGSVALAGVSTAAEQYTLGPIAVDGTPLLGAATWTLNLGNRPFELAAGGDPYDTFVGIMERKPVLELHTLDMGASWNSFGPAGYAFSSLTFALRKKNPDSTGNVADGTAAHILFTATAGKIQFIKGSGGQNNPRQATLRARLRAPAAGTAVLTVNTATALS